MKNRLFSALVLATLFLQAASLSAQNAQAAIYVLYSSSNMDLLDYRTAYSNTSATYYAYALHTTGSNDRFLIYTGNGTYTENLPQGTVSSRDFRLTDDLRDAVNRFTRQLFVVNQLQRGFSVVPVTSITRVTKSGNYYLVNAPDYSFVFDTASLAMGRELAQPGSRSSVSLVSFGVKNCRNYYTFRRTPQQAGQEQSEFEFIPSIGVSMQRSGRTAAEMQANQVSLWGVNSLALEDYIQRSCGGQQATTGAVLPPPPSGNASTGYEPRPGDPATAGTVTTPLGGMGLVSSLSGQPIVNCPVQPRAGYHVVQPKETLSAIARYYGVTNQQILTWNKIKDANKITVCQELRIAPPGAAVQQAKGPTLPSGTTTIQQQQKGTSVQQVVLPPQQPVQQPQYQPVQPAPSTEMPDLFNGGSPLTYSTPQPQYNLAAGTTTASPVTYSTQAAAPNSWQYHTVQTGESVYAIATRYGYTQERLRRMNGFPATGDIPLQYGQLIKISDCACAPGGGTSSATPIISTPGTNSTSPVVYSTPTTTTPQAGGMLKIPQTGTTTPAATQPAATGSQFVPLGNNSTVSAASPTTTTPETPRKREPLSFRDYYVKDSESIRDIARKERLDPTELGLINGRDPNEVLPPGTRVQIPIY